MDAIHWGHLIYFTLFKFLHQQMQRLKIVSKQSAVHTNIFSILIKTETKQLSLSFSVDPFICVSLH